VALDEVSAAIAGKAERPEQRFGSRAKTQHKNSYNENTLNFIT
jgi:hypothetical protein